MRDLVGHDAQLSACTHAPGINTTRSTWCMGGTFCCHSAVARDRARRSKSACAGWESRSPVVVVEAMVSAAWPCGRRKWPKRAAHIVSPPSGRYLVSTCPTFHSCIRPVAPCATRVISFYGCSARQPARRQPFARPDLLPPSMNLLSALHTPTKSLPVFL